MPQKTRRASCRLLHPGYSEWRQLYKDRRQSPDLALSSSVRVMRHVLSLCCPQRATCGFKFWMALCYSLSGPVSSWSPAHRVVMRTNRDGPWQPRDQNLKISFVYVAPQAQGDLQREVVVRVCSWIFAELVTSSPSCNADIWIRPPGSCR